MQRNALTIGRILGIPIRIHTSWFLIFVLVTWSLATGYFPQRYPLWPGGQSWAVGLATSLLFFLSVLLHELAHALVARWWGMPIHDIVLFIFGGVAELTEEPERPRIEFFMALVGPLTSFALAILFLIIWLFARRSAEPLAALSIYLAGMNASLGGFNLIPGFPLDGGRVLRSLLWGATNNLEKATRWATGVGQAVAYLFILLGALQAIRGQWASGIWIAFIGWFLENTAQTSYRQVAFRAMLQGYKVEQVMTRECHPLSPDITLEALVRNYILPLGLRCFPVVVDGAIQGVVSVPLIKKVPEESWPMVTVRAVTLPLEQVGYVRPADSLWMALNKMTSEQREQLPVSDGDGEFVGVLTYDQVMRFIQQHSRLRI